MLHEEALEYHARPAREDRGRDHQAVRDPARPRLGLHPGRGGPGSGHSAGPAGGVPLHRPREPGGRRHQRHRRARLGQRWAAGRQAGDGGQGAAVQAVRRRRRVRHRDRRRPIRTTWCGSSRRSNPPSAVSTSKTSARRECFEIEERLSAAMDIPVFHDDQHGTAIISGAALLNALELAGKDIGEVRMVVNGAGAAAVACCEFFISLGHAARATSCSPTPGAWSTVAAPTG